MLARMHSMQQAMAKQRQHTRRKFQQPLPRGLLVLPYLSIVSEKTQHMSTLLAGIKWRVQGYQGDTEGQPLSNKVIRSQSSSTASFHVCSMNAAITKRHLKTCRHLDVQAERIAICSIEKANMAVNHLIQEGRLHELVSVVVDEAHMLADPHRWASS